MYAPFFGLQHTPFSIAPDPRYLFMSERHREALAHLLYGLEAGGGFVLLTGEVGAGKTTVCRCFLEQIPAHCDVAYIFNPKLTVGELLRSICDELGVAHQPAVPGAETVKDCIDPLNQYLLKAHAAGRNTVLIIDEAQNLAADVLEQLRLLTNLETSERKLLQIILIGQPELRAMVASAPLEQLAQRVIARFHLDALSAGETQQYIAHRLSVAGLQGPVPFTRRAMRRVHALSRGVPRRINLLCDRALLGAYALGAREVDAAIITQAAREVFDADAPAPRSASAARSGAPAWPRRALLAGLAALVGAAVAVFAGWGLGAWPESAGRHVSAAGAAPVAARQVAASMPAAEPAQMASAPAEAASAPVQGLQPFLQALPASDAPAWQALASGWGVSLLEGADPCAAVLREGLRCYRNRRAGLSLVRQIDRPVLITLFPAEHSDASATALLRGLDADTATLEGGGRTVRVPLSELAAVWRGEIATLWRAPPGMPAQGEITDTPAGAAWLDAQWTGAPAGTQTGLPITPALRQARIQRFQLAQGVTPDGVAGPLTLMLLNRQRGVNEPRLHTGP